MNSDTANEVINMSLQMLGITVSYSCQIFFLYITWSYCVAQVGLERLIPLHPPPRYSFKLWYFVLKIMFSKLDVSMIPSIMIQPIKKLPLPPM